MKAVVPEIAWHNKNPVFTVDIQSTLNNEFYRAATGGGDSHVVIWHLVWNEATNEITTNFVADLDRHIKAVNVVRFSKNGKQLASGDDDATIIIWELRDMQSAMNTSFVNNESNKENWVSVKTLRGHKDDIYDLCWAPFSNHLLSGSVDNTAIIWNVQTGLSTGILGEHNGFVQGVAWDPKGKSLATLSSDRALRVFDADLRKMTAKITKAKFAKLTEKSKEAEPDMEENHMRLFHDDTVKTFFRRLTFSPDGILIFAPCGIFKDCENEVKAPTDVTYVFLKAKPDRPILHLPSPDEYTVAVRCCPVLFELNNPTESNFFGLPYRIVFAIASRRSIVFYDTQQTSPFAYVSDIHYATLTDISWSCDGKLLLASSSDGYCTIVTFDRGELGVPFGRNTPTFRNDSINDVSEDLGVEVMNRSEEGNMAESVAGCSGKSQKVSPVGEAPTNDSIDRVASAPVDFRKEEVERRKEEEKEVGNRKEEVERRQEDGKEVGSRKAEVDRGKEEEKEEGSRKAEVERRMEEEKEEGCRKAEVVAPGESNCGDLKAEVKDPTDSPS